MPHDDARDARLEVEGLGQAWKLGVGWKAAVARRPVARSSSSILLSVTVV